MKSRVFLGLLLLLGLGGGEAAAQCTAGGTITQVCGIPIQGNTTFVFTGLNPNKFVNIGGVQFAHPNGGQSYSALEIATAFSNIASGGTCAPANLVSGSTCTGTLAAGWSSGPVINGTTVVFTYVTPSNVPPISVTENNGGCQCLATGSPTVVQGSAGDLSTLLTNKMVCVANPLPGTNAGPPWYNQEYHASSGRLIDFKKGASDPVDPTKDIGTWAITGAPNNCTVQYVYTGGPTFNYTLFRDSSDNSYNFCQGSSLTVKIAASRFQGPFGSAQACTGS